MTVFWIPKNMLIFNSFLNQKIVVLCNKMTQADSLMWSKGNWLKEVILYTYKTPKRMADLYLSQITGW